MPIWNDEKGASLVKSVKAWTKIVTSLTTSSIWKLTVRISTSLSNFRNSSLINHTLERSAQPGNSASLCFDDLMQNLSISYPQVLFEGSSECWAGGGLERASDESVWGENGQHTPVHIQSDECHPGQRNSRSCKCHG